jgi:uncharacterized membrane protein YeaQ/YmgE (transglycosylase-associated protein family)
VALFWHVLIYFINALNHKLISGSKRISHYFYQGQQNTFTLMMAKFLSKEWRGVLDRERIVTIGIVVGIFGGLVGGPILSLADYYAPPEKRFWTFIIPEFIGFGCLILMAVWGKSRKRKKLSTT